MRFVLVHLAMLFWCAPLAHAQPDIHRLPPGAMAAWVFDPDPAWEQQPAGAIVPSLRAALATGLIRDEDASIAAKVLLAFAASGEHPHRLVIHRFEAEPVSTDGGMDIIDFGAVLEIRTRKSHRPLVGTIESILVPKGDVSVSQREIDLPGGRSGVELTRSDFEPWARVAWLSEEGVFTIGIGRSPLRDWLRWRDNPNQPDAPSGLSSLREQRGAGRRVVEAWLDLNALRRAFPLAFDSSRLERGLRAVGAINARQIALLGTADALDAQPVVLTWGVAPRTEKPGTWVTEQLTVTDWPNTVRRPGASVHSLIFPLRPHRLERLTMAVYRASLKPRSLFGFGIQYRQWQARRGRALDQLIASLGGRVLIADVPASPVRFPGFATIAIPLRPGADDDTARAALDAVLMDFSPELRRDGRTGLWSIGLTSAEADPAGLLRIGAIGIAGERPALMVSWSPSALLEAARLWGGRAP